MLKKDLKSNKRCSVLWLVLVIISLTLISYSQAGNVAMLVQQSPVDGGSVEPGTGVHKMNSNSQLPLRAVPKPGYQFVTWLGDVDEPTSQVTTAYADSPKIIIAVFERVEYDSVAASELITSAEGGGGTASTASYVRGGRNGGSVRNNFKGYPGIIQDEDELPDDFPVPNDGDDFPVPGDETVPEPATVFLLGLGGLVTVVRRRTLKA